MVVMLRFNQPVRAADVAAAPARARSTRHDWEEPALSAEGLAHLKATDPSSVQRFNAKVEATRAVANATGPVTRAPDHRLGQEAIPRITGPRRARNDDAGAARIVGASVGDDDRAIAGGPGEAVVGVVVRHRGRARVLRGRLPLRARLPGRRGQSPPLQGAGANDCACGGGEGRRRDRRLASRSPSRSRSPRPTRRARSSSTKASTSRSRMPASIRSRRRGRSP